MPRQQSQSLDAVSHELPEVRIWSGPPSHADLAALPARPAVYLLLAAGKLPLQLATTQNLRRVMVSRLLETPSGRRKVDLASVVQGVRYRRVYSIFEARWRYYLVARKMYPKEYRRLIAFGPAFFLHLDWSQPVPELRITDRPWEQPGPCQTSAYVGPWLTHDTCQKALEGLCDLFELCRFPQQIRRAPAGQRCLYADMGRCDAPCEGAVPLESYRERVRQAWEFACGTVRPWIDAAKQRLRAAASEQQFETAALLKRQIAWAWKWHDFLRPWLHPLEKLNYLLAVPVVGRRSWRLFLFWQGDLYDGPAATDRTLPAQARRFLAAQQSAERALVDPQIRTEQTWLVAHYLRSKLGDATIVIHLGDQMLPEDLQPRLQQEVARRRASESASELRQPPGTAAKEEIDSASRRINANSFDSPPAKADTSNEG